MALDRFFVAFVSSTFTDLQIERKAIAESLLRVKTFPLGMEYFPSTGGSQWSYIEESMLAADFFVFVSAGRYGSVDTASNVSWTQREYREAKASGKPIIVLLRRSLDTLSVSATDRDEAKRELNMAFRKELEDSQECQYFDTVGELEVALLHSVDYLKASTTIAGWTRTPPSSIVIDQDSFDRLYVLTESHHHYSKSQTNSERFDLSFKGRRVVKATQPHGLSHVTIDFTKSSDKSAGFSWRRPVRFALESSRRDGPGRVILGEPRKATGAVYARDIKFDPPLRQNESADFAFEAFLPEYRFSKTADILDASISDPQGQRAFDYVTRRISHPTSELIQSVSFDQDLDVKLLGPRNGQHGRLDFGDQTLPASDSLREGSDNNPGRDSMEYRSTNPQLFSTYRLAWSLPN